MSQYWLQHIGISERKSYRSIFFILYKYITWHFIRIQQKHIQKSNNLNEIIGSMYSTFTQKNRQIVQRLSRKLDLDQQQSVNKEDYAQNKGLDQKYKEILQKIKIFKTKNERNQLQVSHQLEKVQDILFSLQRTKNKNNDVQSQSYQSFQKLVQNQQNQNSQKMTAIRKGMIQDIDRKKKAMKTDAIQIFEAEFELMCKNNLTDIQKKMSVITSMLEQQRQSNQQSAQYLAQTIGEQILKMQQMIAEQKQSRKNGTKDLLDMISEVQNRIGNQISQQNRARSKEQDHIEIRLEQICYKMQAKILGSC